MNPNSCYNEIINKKKKKDPPKLQKEEANFLQRWEDPTKKLNKEAANFYDINHFLREVVKS